MNQSKPNRLGKGGAFLTLLLLCVFKVGNIVALASTDAITKPLTNLNTLLTSLVVGVGGILFIWGIVSIAGALLNSHDGSQIMNGVWKVVAGFLLLSVSLVLNFLKG